MGSMLKFIKNGKPYYPQMLLSVLLNVLTIGSSIALMSTSAFLITMAGFHPSIAELQVAIVGVRFFGISRGVFRYLERLVSHAVNFRILTGLRVWFFDRYEAAFPMLHQHVEQGDMVNRALDDIDTLENLYVRIISPAAAAFILSVVTSLILGSYQFTLGLILFGGLTLSGLLIPMLTFFVVRKMGTEVQTLKGKYRAQLTRVIQGAEEIIVYRQQANAAERLQKTARKIKRKEDALDALSEGITLINFLLLQGTFIITLLMVIQAAQNNGLNPVLISVSGLMVLASFEATQPLGVAAVQLGKVKQAIERLEEVTRTEPQRIPGQGISIDGIPEIRFEHVAYQYEKDQPPAVQDINFSIGQHQKLAIVGPSGGGKSTILQLLQGFRTPTTGKIWVAGLDLRDVELVSYRSHFSVAGQEPFLFHQTLRDNLSFGNRDDSDGLLIDGLAFVLLDGWFARLPKGLDTVLHESAVNISAGEKQRLAIARAWLKETPYLILDEPTANLDAETEDVLMQRILGKEHQRSVVWITHRMKYLSRFDEILFVQQGSILERGNFDELLQQGGAFYHYWQIQNEYLS